jgi:hypothetical protein
LRNMAPATRRLSLTEVAGLRSAEYRKAKEPRTVVRRAEKHGMMTDRKRHLVLSAAPRDATAQKSAPVARFAATRRLFSGLLE